MVFGAVRAGPGGTPRNGAPVPSDLDPRGDQVQVSAGRDEVADSGLGRIWPGKTPG
jgi:hypothetical protein